MNSEPVEGPPTRPKAVLKSAPSTLTRAPPPVERYVVPKGQAVVPVFDISDFPMTLPGLPSSIAMLLHQPLPWHRRHQGGDFNKGCLFTGKGEGAFWLTSADPAKSPVILASTSSSSSSSITMGCSQAKKLLVQTQDADGAKVRP